MKIRARRNRRRRGGAVVTGAADSAAGTRGPGIGQRTPDGSYSSPRRPQLELATWRRVGTWREPARVSTVVEPRSVRAGVYFVALRRSPCADRAKIRTNRGLARKKAAVLERLARRDKARAVPDSLVADGRGRKQRVVSVGRDPGGVSRPHGRQAKKILGLIKDPV